MANIVFILGAGASREAGAPLMNDFLDVADNLWKSGEVGDKAQQFELVFKTIGALQAVHSKAQLDLINIESVFATLELAKILNKLPGTKPSALNKIIAALKDVIVVTLERTLRFPVINNKVHPPPPYRIFIELLCHLQKKAHPINSVAIITFNYDMAVDYALHVNGMGPNYCLSEKSTVGIPLLKLHGSLNWAYCNKCNSVVPWSLDQYFSMRQWRDLEEKKNVTLQIGSELSQFEHCGMNVPPEPILVPPTWNKAYYQEKLSPVWSRATKELEEAEHIFIIGYSLSPMDAFFRLLYALGTVSEKTLKRIWVYNPSKDSGVEERFRGLLGPGAHARFLYITTGFEGAISNIKMRFPGRS